MQASDKLYQASSFIRLVPCPAGGHRMEQQKTTTQHLWQLVKPGGIFVMEVSSELLMAAIQSFMFCAFSRQDPENLHFVSN